MNREQSTPRACVLLALVLLSAGCVTQQGKGNRSPASNPSAPELDHQRLILSEGYSILRNDAEGFSRAKLLLYFKVESDDFERVIAHVADFGTDLKAELARVDRDYPGVRTDLDPLPEMEKRKRMTTALDKVRENAPLVGNSGREYERTVLISISNGLNQERHLAGEISKEEPDAGLKKFMLGVKARMDALYAETEALLRKSYYRQ
ncbi:MAG: hypothetical protein ABI661_02240 [Gammaproteobacteria bacterium]